MFDCVWGQITILLSFKVFFFFLSKTVNIEYKSMSLTQAFLLQYCSGTNFSAID